MKFAKKEQKGATIIALSGNVMGGPDATVLNQQIHQLISDGTRKVVIDLADVQFVNSSGLGMLIGSLTTMRNAGGELKIACASKKVETLIEVTKLDRVFDLHKTVNAAIASFK
jgi:anti-sigma B factor antagonist